MVAAAGRRRPSTFALGGATGKGNVRRRRNGESTCSAVAAGEMGSPRAVLRAGTRDLARCTETQCAWRADRGTIEPSGALVQDCPDSARVVVVDQLARSTLLADNLRVKSKVHPKYKTKYHVGNWPEYEPALVRRGDVTLWRSAEAMDAWRPAAAGRPGGPRKFSDVSIMTALMLRLVFRLPLRQTEASCGPCWP